MGATTIALFALLVAVAVALPPPKVAPSGHHVQPGHQQHYKSGTKEIDPMMQEAVPLPAKLPELAPTKVMEIPAMTTEVAAIEEPMPVKLEEKFEAKPEMAMMSMSEEKSEVKPEMAMVETPALIHPSETSALPSPVDARNPDFAALLGMFGKSTVTSTMTSTFYYATATVTSTVIVG